MYNFKLQCSADSPGHVSLSASEVAKKFEWCI